MNIGRFLLEHLSEGRFDVYPDGTFKKLGPHREKSYRKSSLTGNQKYTTTIGIDPVLIMDHNRYILLDTGLGWGLDAKSSYQKASNIKSNLQIFNISVDQISDVILTHLHYDHAAGSTYTNDDSIITPTFPDATYHVQKREWDYALSRIESNNPVRGADYQLDDMYRLMADEYISFIDKDYQEILPGIEVIWTGGHTPGHQIVRINSQEDVAYYMGDLVPTDSHLNHYAMKQMDLNPEQSKQMKTVLLNQALKEDAFLLFYHSLHTKHGKLSKDKHRKYKLQE